MKRLLIMLAALSLLVMPMSAMAHVKGWTVGDTVLKSDDISDEGSGQVVDVNIRVTADVYPYITVLISEQHIHWEITKPGKHTAKGPKMMVSGNSKWEIEMEWTPLKNYDHELETWYELVKESDEDGYVLLCGVDVPSDAHASANSYEYCTWPGSPVEEQEGGWYEGAVYITISGHI